MQIAVLADEVMKAEFMAKPVPSDVEILWCGTVRSFVATVADAYFDLLFTPDPERTRHLAQRSQSPLFINAVDIPTAAAGDFFIRLNAWPGFLQRPVVEVAISGPHHEPTVKTIFDKLNWHYQIVPDIPGMITPRIIAAIINEAYYTFGDGISTKDEIDIAMKTGTSYPHGPFEWAEKIGTEKIYSLLTELGKKDSRFKVAPELEKEIRQKHVE